MSSWLIATSASLVSGLIVLFVERLMSPRPERSRVPSNVHIDITTIKQRINYGDGSSRDSNESGSIAVAAFIGVAAITLFFAFLPVAAGLILGVAASTFILVLVCVVRSIRLKIWPDQALFAVLYSIIAFGIAAYSWWLVFFYSRNEFSAQRIASQVKGEGTGSEYLGSLVGSVLNVLMPGDNMQFAVGILGAVALSTALVTMTLIAAYRWIAFTSIAYAVPQRFAKLRIRAATNFMNFGWNDLWGSVVVAAMAIFISPPILLNVLSSFA